MTTGIRIADLPDLGAVTDICKIVGDHSGSGTFLGTALKGYIGGTVNAINVRDAPYYATGNGTTDDTAALQAAFDAAATSGRT
jgi:hypothetical protein